ncbi:endonuclease/exonuclease/phosphatase family protein [Ruania zhangjianzhongii]|uniref:endonuclease/exonuclease/phosphatase family protein n=1 Tax=Ruania zhangjianzhongii TaxID=2603206 RepID=UPI0011C71BC5|nr:endonuclease/exonuclease/phosphatase family protein [Ruania zhangjianzhongii]
MTLPDDALGTVSFTTMTYNLWGDHFIEERVDALRALFAIRPPDILGTQELTPRLQALLDEALPDHDRVHDDFPGWSTRSNIWWRREMFELIEHGHEDIGILVKHGALFWARLRPRGVPSQELLFSTSHLTFQRNPAELADLRNRRVPQARAAIAELERLSPDGTVIFTADINDVAPAQLEFGLAGYRDCFTALGRHMPPTHPVPASVSLEGVWSPESPIAGAAKGIDVIFARGALAARTAEAVEFFHRGKVASDHMPVVATYTFTG